MKLKLIAAVATASVLGLAGCSNMTPNQKETLSTVGGAAAGGVVGEKLLGGPVGTLGGAAAGGYLGNKLYNQNQR